MPLAGALAQTTNITIFHVNPDVYGSAPINMDIADIRGDAFFDLRSVLSPMECRDPNARSSDCSNPEVTARDLVITKLVLEIDPYYGEYAFCNVCVNGSAGISGHCDVEGAYVCKCGQGPQPPYPGNVGYRYAWPQPSLPMQLHRAPRCCHHTPFYAASWGRIPEMAFRRPGLPPPRAQVLGEQVLREPQLQREQDRVRGQLQGHGRRPLLHPARRPRHSQ